MSSTLPRPEYHSFCAGHGGDAVLCGTGERHGEPGGAAVEVAVVRAPRLRGGSAPHVLARRRHIAADLGVVELDAVPDADTGRVGAAERQVAVVPLLLRHLAVEQVGECPVSMQLLDARGAAHLVAHARHTVGLVVDQVPGEPVAGVGELVGAVLEGVGVSRGQAAVGSAAQHLAAGPLPQVVLPEHGVPVVEELALPVDERVTMVVEGLADVTGGRRRAVDELLGLVRHALVDERVLVAVHVVVDEVLELVRHGAFVQVGTGACRADAVLPVEGIHEDRIDLQLVVETAPEVAGGVEAVGAPVGLVADVVDHDGGALAVHPGQRCARLVPPEVEDVRAPDAGVELLAHVLHLRRRDGLVLLRRCGRRRQVVPGHVDVRVHAHILLPEGHLVGTGVRGISGEVVKRQHQVRIAAVVLRQVRRQRAGRHAVVEDLERRRHRLGLRRAVDRDVPGGDRRHRGRRRDQQHDGQQAPQDEVPGHSHALSFHGVPATSAAGAACSPRRAPSALALAWYRHRAERAAAAISPSAHHPTDSPGAQPFALPGRRHRPRRDRGVTRRRRRHLCL